jgi:hypothetical protein
VNHKPDITGIPLRFNLNVRRSSLGAAPRQTLGKSGARELRDSLPRTCSPDLLEPPVNVLHLSLHPEGLAPMIRNLAEWRQHVLEHLRDQVETSGNLLGHRRSSPQNEMIACRIARHGGPRT